MLAAITRAHYPDMICDFLEEMTDETLSYRVASLALSYIKESHLGATLTVYRSQIREDDTVDIRTVNEDMQICLEASVRFARSDMIEIRD